MPQARQACTPYLCCRDAARALEFYAKAFGAETRKRYTDPSGRIGHAELGIEGATVHGDRGAILRDPLGHRWFIATPIENVATEEIQKRVGNDFRIE